MFLSLETIYTGVLTCKKYILKITDPVVIKIFDNKYPGLDAGTKIFELEKKYKLCISISDLYDKTQKHYKLVASIPGFNL